MIDAALHTKSTEGHTVCASGEVALIIWKQVPTEAGIRDLRGIFERIHARRPKEKFAMMVVVEDDAGFGIPKEPREQLKALLKQYQESLAVSVIVLTATGPLAAVGLPIARSVANTFNLFTKGKSPTVVEVEVASGVASVKRYLPHLDPDRLLAAVKLARGDAKDPT